MIHEALAEIALPMFKNYLLIAWRSITKNKTTTTINVMGLSIGITAALVVYLFVQYNFSFDRFEPARDRIYRVVTDGPGSKNPGVPIPLAATLQQAVTGIENTAAIFQYYDGNASVSIPGSSGKFKGQGGIVLADSNYFRLIPHQWLAGYPSTSLNNPYELVLTQTRAQIWFPGLTPDQLLGKEIILSDSVHAVVAGVVKDLDANSDFEYQAYLSMATLPVAGFRQNYGWSEWASASSNNQVLVKLMPGIAPAQVNRQLAAIFKEHFTDPETAKNTYRLQELSDIHTNADFGGKVNSQAVGGLILLVVFLLLLGSVNFINLSTAQASTRAKEIGIRKTFGGSRRQLILQFLTETLLLTLVTVAIASVLVALALRAFIPEDLPPGRMISLPSTIGFVSLLVLGVTLLSGLYPAFVLARFKPARILKNQVFTTRGENRTASLRKTLIVFQFVVAQVFVVGVIVVNKQVHYALKKDMGFRKEAILNIDLPSDTGMATRKYVFNEALRSVPGIQRTSLGGQSPAFSGQTANLLTAFEKGKEIKLHADERSGDTAYLSLYNIHLLAGRNIHTVDSATEVLVNETLCRQLGFQEPAAALGHYINFNGTDLPVVGVMADFNQASVKTAIHPLFFYASADNGNTLHLALQPEPASWKNSIAQIERLWKSVYPEYDFNLRFLDESISNFYGQDRMLSVLLSFCAFIAILISCMGMLGLVIFMTANRTREIGIRKILGASAARIILLLSADFVRLLFLAIIIAVPLAGWLLHNWLQTYAYHTGLSWWVFALSGSSMVVIALSILCAKAARVALSNPVKALRTE